MPPTPSIGRMRESFITNDYIIAFDSEQTKVMTRAEWIDPGIGETTKSEIKNGKVLRARQPDWLIPPDEFLDGFGTEPSSASSGCDFMMERPPFGTGVIDAKLPVDAALLAICVRLPCAGSGPQLFDRRESATLHARTGHRTRPFFRGVQPTAVSGGCGETPDDAPANA